MKAEVKQSPNYRIEIIPETDAEEIFIREVLELNNDGDYINAVFEEWQGKIKMTIFPPRKSR